MRVALVLFALFLAGCSGAGDYSQPDGADTGSVQETLEDHVAGEPEMGAVAGTVRNINGAVLSEAQVLLLGLTGTTTTGPDGAFEMRNVPPSPYTMRVDRRDYLSLERDITVQAGKITRLNITLVDASVGGDPGFREHLHDRWRGATQLTLFEGTVRHDHAYLPQGSYSAPCVRGFGLNTGAGNDCYDIRLPLESGTIVPVGTQRITFTADWDKTDFVPEVRLRYQAANADDFNLSEPLFPGDSIDIPIVHPMPDHGHQENTLWRFRLVAEPDVAGVVLVSEHFNEQFVGDFDVSLVAHKGTVPPEAPHPRYWAEGDTVVILEELSTKVTSFPALPKTRDPTTTACSNVMACFVLPGGTVVPAGTTRLLVTLDYEAGTAALEPHLTRKTLAFRTSAIHPDDATLDNIRVDAPADIEVGHTHYELDIGEGEADPFYQPRSNWLFLIANEGDERSDGFNEDCTGVIVGCGGTTYKLRVVAINDNWTPELAGIEE